jgi:hypothetical protein
MAKWVRHFFRGTAADGSHFPMSGPAYRGLAIVRIEKAVYSLTHMKTGLRVNTVNGDYPSVRRFSEAVAELIDWDQLSSVEEIMAVEGLDGRIRAIAEFNSFQDVGEIADA